MQDYSVGGGSVRKPQTQEVPEHIKFAQEAAKERIESLRTDPNSIFDAVTYAQEGLSDEQIKEAASAFAAETLKYYDEEYGNGDGETSVEEYIKANVEIGIENSELMASQSGLDPLTDEEKEIYQRTNELLATNLDVNGDGKISTEEEAFILYRADGLNDQENFIADGTASSEFLDSMGKSVSGQYSKQREIVESYINGETLTSEEQTELDNLTPIIRGAVAEDATQFGFDLTGNSVEEQPATQERKGLFGRIGDFFKNLFTND